MLSDGVISMNKIIINNPLINKKSYETFRYQAYD